MTQIAGLEALIDAALTTAVEEIEAVQAVERADVDKPFWYVRLDGEAKQHFSAEFTLDQRTFSVMSYFMPEPEENREEVFSHLLVRNRTMRDLHFCIGKENAVYLQGRIDNRFVDAEVVDRLLGSVYDHTEQFFVPAMRLGYSSRFDR